MHNNDKSNRTIFGDAAAATLISTEGFAGIEDFVLGTDGAGAENLIVKNGGVRFPKSGEITEDATETPGDHLYMDGPAIFNFTMDAVPQLVEQVLEKHKLAKEETDYFVFHQANQFMLNFLRKKIGITEEQFIYHMQDCGNTVSSTIPIVLYHMKEDGMFNKKTKTLLAGFGVGYSWGGTILTTE
jgi:3-oxoacyl-[acyl-carrier-protein] synthase III